MSKPKKDIKHTVDEQFQWINITENKQHSYSTKNQKEKILITEDQLL